MMRLATYNIWNSDAGMPHRTRDIIRTLQGIQADILCLQEVRNDDFHNLLEKELQYPYHVFRSYKDGAEGLSIFSLFPIEECNSLPHALIAKVKLPNLTAAIGNVHLPWDSVLKRETESIHLHRVLTDSGCELRLLAGDFNSSERSSVHRFFLGEASLHSAEATPCWFDLAEGFACREKISPDATLNFYQNPRWANETTVESSRRFDKILLQNPYPSSFPRLDTVSIFGTEISETTGLSASDHYGVYADLTIK